MRGVDSSACGGRGNDRTGIFVFRVGGHTNAKDCYDNRNSHDVRLRRTVTLREAKGLQQILQSLRSFRMTFSYIVVPLARDMVDCEPFRRMPRNDGR